MMRFALALLLLWPGIASAWSSHYLMTDRALQHPSEKDLAGQTVRVETLESFLKAEGPGIEQLVSDYYDWLDGHGVPGRHTRQSYDPSAPTREAFLHALRLNPKTTTPYVLRVLPADAKPEQTLPLDAVSRYLKPTPPLDQWFVPAPPGTELTVPQVFRTFSDEPDWGMDLDLWTHTEYGYGTEPYGEPSGTSSQAAFHMKFAHEPWLVQHFVPELADGMPIERMELFVRLSHFAFQTGHPYWGWRFLAWATHYAQDLAQPYHSRALPGEGTLYYLHYIVSLHKDAMKKDATQLAKNRHFIYEDFVAYGLQQSYLVQDEMYADLASYLYNGDALLQGGHSDATAIADTVMASAAVHAPVIDATIVKAFGPHLTDDPTYDVETAPDYDITKVVKAVPPGEAHDLLSETGKDFQDAGEATRSMIALVAKDAAAAKDEAPEVVPEGEDASEGDGD